MSSVRRKLAAVLFADLVGFTRQVSADETAGLERRRMVEQLIRTRAAAHRGRTVKSIGDAVMLEFGSAVDAVTCALDIQEGVQSLDEELQPLHPLRVRIGIHAGDVVEEDDDLYGHAVNLAQRVQKMAQPGGICFTREVYAQVRPVLRLRCQPVEAAPEHDLPEPVEVLEVLAQDGVGSLDVERARPARPAAVAPARKSGLLDSEQLKGAWGAFKHLMLGEDESHESRPLCLERVQDAAAGPTVPQRVTRFSRALASFVIGALLFSGAGAMDDWPGLWNLVETLLRIGGVGSAVFGFGNGWGAFFSTDEIQGIDDEIAERCAKIGAAPAAVEGPVTRALIAYVSIHEVGHEDAWDRAKLPVKEYVKQARAQLLALLDRAGQITRVSGVVQRYEGKPNAPADYPELAALYERHCERLSAAADVFEQAEAGLSRALLAVTDEPRSNDRDALRQMSATFAALAEVLESMDARPLPADTPPPKPQSLRPVEQEARLD